MKVVIIVSSLATACLFILQGIHLFKNGGRRRLFAENSGKPNQSHTWLTETLFYTIAGTAILLILTVALYRADKEPVVNWLRENGMRLLIAFGFVALGLRGVLWPDAVIRDIRSVHPLRELTPEQENHLRTTIVGVYLVFTVVGLLVTSGIPGPEVTESLERNIRQVN